MNFLISPVTQWFDRQFIIDRHLMDDLELLWEYGRSGSEAAFATVAGRYVDLVYSAALRQVRDPHVAEDVTQAVLIILMSRAAALPAGTVVPGWLLKVTRYASLDAIKMRNRRSHYERQAAAERSRAGEQRVDPPAPTWAELSPVIDEALFKLRSEERDAIVLRYLLNKSSEEIAWALGVSEETARQRVSRAMARLRSIFAKRGIRTMEEALGSAMLAGAVLPSPPAVIAIAKGIASPVSGALSTPPTVIVRGAVKKMAFAKLKWVVVCGSVLAIAIAIVLFLYANRSSHPVDATPPSHPIATAKAPKSLQQSAAESIHAAAMTHYQHLPPTLDRLHMAAIHNDLIGVREFLAAGDNVNAISRDGNDTSPLMYACLAPHDESFDVVKTLVDAGADANVTLRGGNVHYTALMRAGRVHSPRVMQLLIDHDANVNATDTKGDSAISWARTENDPTVIAVLEKAGAK